MATREFQLQSWYLGGDFYKLLGVPPAATKKDIQIALRKKRQKLNAEKRVNMDVFEGTTLDPFIQATFDAQEKELTYAYELLQDEGTKEYYDLHKSTFFGPEMDKRKENRKDEIEQIRVSREEARRRVGLINEATEAQAEKRRGLVAEKEELQKRLEGIRSNPAEVANKVILDKRIGELTEEIKACDKPIRDLNEQFTEDTETKRKEKEKEKEKEAPKESDKDSYRRQWMNFGRSAQRFQDLADNPPHDATEDEMSNWRQQAAYEKRQAQDFKAKFEDELRKEREATAGGTGAEGAGATGTKDAEEGDTDGAGAGEGDTGGADEFDGDPGFGMGGDQQGPPRGSARDYFRTRWDKFQRGRRAGQQQRDEKHRRKQAENEGSDQTREEAWEQSRQTTNDEWQQQQEARQEQREAGDRARQHARDTRTDWRSFFEGLRHWSNRRQAEINEETNNNNAARQSMAARQEEAARRRAGRAGMPYPGDEGATAGGTGGEGTNGGTGAGGEGTDGGTGEGGEGTDGGTGVGGEGTDGGTGVGGEGTDGGTGVGGEGTDGGTGVGGEGTDGGTGVGGEGTDGGTGVGGEGTDGGTGVGGEGTDGGTGVGGEGTDGGTGVGGEAKG